jgi:hypothetical protein
MSNTHHQPPSPLQKHNNPALRYLATAPEH